LDGIVLSIESARIMRQKLQSPWISGESNIRYDLLLLLSQNLLGYLRACSGQSSASRKIMPRNWRSLQEQKVSQKHPTATFSEPTRETHAYNCWKHYALGKNLPFNAHLPSSYSFVLSASQFVQQ
jgi:hypothetical protein